MNSTEARGKVSIRSTPARLLLTLAITCLITLWLLLGNCVMAESNKGPGVSRAPIKVINPHRLPDKDIAVVRSPLGIPEDYKPWVVRLKNSELLIVAFCYYGKPFADRAVFWRSGDGGRTWSKRVERKDIPGREFSLTCLADGTLIMPGYLLSNDVNNNAGHVYSMVYRSTDNGKSWSVARIGPEGFPDGARTALDRNAIELPDPKAPNKTMVLLGVSQPYGGKSNPAHVYLWRSWDSGKTWDKTLKPDTQNHVDVDGFFCQSSTYLTVSGKLLHPIRVDRTGPHWKIPGRADLKKEAGDQGDRMMLWESTDNGASWRKHNTDGNFGTYGEMYPRYLRLSDGRLLLTFTVRSNSTDGYPLGLRAIISYDDGETWNFKQDRLVISYVNEGASGGGYGNTIQLDDGMLVSVYSYRGTDTKTHVEAVRWQLPL